MRKEVGRGDFRSEGKCCRFGQWGCRGESGGFFYRDVVVGSRVRVRGFFRGLVGIQQRFLFYLLEVFLRGMEVNLKVKGYIGQVGCDECYSFLEERVMSYRVDFCSFCFSYFGGLCQRISGFFYGLVLFCFKGFVMVISWVFCCLQENCVFDYFIRFWGFWFWIRKYCGAEGEA